MIRIGILNIFWFGLLPPNDTLDVGFYHSPADDGRVRDLIAFADLQVLALVEIVDVKRLETILATLPGKWRARDPNDEVVASRAPGAVADALQRVVFAWNDDEIELVDWGRPIHEGPRAPVVARVRHRTSGFAATMIGIHPKSGNPIGWQNQSPTSIDHIAGENRTKFFKGLVGWLSAAAATFPAPYVVLGDFNSIRDSSECDALRNLPGWTWPMPVFIPTTADARTTRTDPAIIDHVVLSPGLTFESTK